ncbi:MAG: ABC transporter ATP-binding protein [Deltaproteobacteria bacterium]|nr:ABC transporter ATP-binding protein [Deltaproteobacteria bacterium]
MKLLDIRNLVAEIEGPSGKIFPIDGLNFSLYQGKVFGLVGESGSGKSMTALSLLRLCEPAKIVGGRILFFEKSEEELPLLSEEKTPLEPLHPFAAISSVEEKLDPEKAGFAIDLRKCSNSELRMFRGKKIAMIFQEPMTALNPVLTVGEQIRETLLAHENISVQEAQERSLALLNQVGIADASRRYHDYPHQLSGGMRQRVMIAMAISCEPQVLIADEPTTALDVTLQAQILDLLKKLVQEKQMALLLISHDLSLVSHYCDEVAVMYAGKIVERAPASELFSRPKHPYTQGLLYSLPTFKTPEEFDNRPALKMIGGNVPNLAKLPKACRFQDRCEKMSPNSCIVKAPPLKYIGEQHWVRCVNA